MKIAYVLNTYPQPSHSFIRREIRALETLGHEVLRIAMRRSEGDLVDSQDIQERAQTHYVLGGGALRLLGSVVRQGLAQPRAMLAGLRVAWRLGRASQVGVLRHLIYLVEACDVARRCQDAGMNHVHAHFGTNAATVAMLAHTLGGPGYSFTVHGPEEYDQPQALSLKAKSEAARFVVAITSFGRSQLSRWVDFDKWDRIRVVHCGIEPEKFPDPDPVPDGAVRLVAIGRFVEQKGQMVLIEAMADLNRHLPGVHLVLIGDGEMRDAIEARIKALDLGHCITLTGWVDELRIRQELAAAHALVMPSFAEGLPMVVMEAMAAGRPVIATYIAGTPELVLQGETGWMVPAGDQAALEQAVLSLAGTDRDRLTEMGRKARARVFERHDVQQEAAKLAAFIQEAAQDQSVST